MTFPAYIDNSMLSDYKRCPTIWRYKYLDKLVKEDKSVHLHVGAVFAYGLEVTRRAYYEHKLRPDDAIAFGLYNLTIAYGNFEPPEKSLKTFERTFFALIDYFIQYPLEDDIIKPVFFGNNHGIEFNFAVPLPVKNPDTGEALLYVGRFDMLAERNGSLFGEDDKTASQLGPSWVKQWELDSQFTGYTWAMAQYGYNLVGFIVRGIAFLTYDIGHAQTIVYRPKWMVQEWLENTCRIIQSMIHDYQTQTYLKALDKSACASYSGCQYHTLCASQYPLSWYSQYVPNTWDPTVRAGFEPDLSLLSLFKG